MTNENAGMKSLIETVEVFRFRRNQTECVDDDILNEISLRIRVNNQDLVSILTIQHEMKELTLGVLFSEGIVNSYSDIHSIEIHPVHYLAEVLVKENAGRPGGEKLLTITPGCGKGLTYINPSKSNLFKKLSVEGNITDAESISNLARELSQSSTLFKRTGCVHVAGISDGKRFLHISEDVGRHNCLDKLTGWSMLNRPAAEKAVMTFSSGRISSEITLKTLRACIPILVSRSAPTYSAVRLAEQYGITLIGFARGNRFNLYSWPERISGIKCRSL